MNDDAPFIMCLSLRRRRRGGAYMLVLGVTFVLTFMGLIVLTVTQIAGRGGNLVRDASEADLLAQSAVEIGLQRTVVNSAWRSTYTSGTETSLGTLGRGTASFKFVDEIDGNLSNDTSHAVRIYGIARVGSATRIYSCSHSATTPLDSLLYPLCANGDINLGTVLLPSGSSPTLFSNGNISAGVATLNSTNLEAAGSISVVLAVGTGTRKTGQPSKYMPDPVAAFSWYQTNGTSISAASLPVSGSTKVIKYRLFSPVTNPFGGVANANGIYVIDLLGADVQVSYTRVYGTLVLLNAGSGSVIQNSNYFAPVVAGYPSLMVKGNLGINTASASLADNSSTGDANVASINYNPAGAPYGGTTDTTFTTTYPSRFEGIVYVTGNVTMSNAPTFNGVVLIGGTCAPGGTSTFNYDTTPYNSPPPGFVGPLLSPVAGSWLKGTGP